MSVFGNSSFGEVAFGEEAGGVPVIPYEESTTATFTDAIVLETVPYSVGEKAVLTDTYTLEYGKYFLAVQNMTMSEATAYSKAYAAKESMLMTAQQTNSVVGYNEISETISIDAQMKIVNDFIASELLTISAADEFYQALHFIDALVITGVIDNHLVATQLVAETLVATAQQQLSTVLSAEESLTLTAALMAAFTKGFNVSETVTATDAVVAGATMVLTFEETVEADAQISLSQLLTMYAEDTINVEVVLRMSDDSFDAWALNPATSGPSRYTNFPMNSMAAWNGQYFGCSDDGVYLLSGDDDAGTDIDASFKTGLLDFGERRLKRVPDVFLGIMTSGALVMKVQSDVEGERTEYWYNVVSHGDAANHRVKVGKGLKGIYWGFELVNVNGADFDLDNMQLQPLVLSRRVGG